MCLVYKTATSPVPLSPGYHHCDVLQRTEVTKFFTSAWLNTLLQNSCTDFAIHLFNRSLCPWSKHLELSNWSLVNSPKLSTTLLSFIHYFSSVSQWNWNQHPRALCIAQHQNYACLDKHSTMSPLHLMTSVVTVLVVAYAMRYINILFMSAT